MEGERCRCAPNAVSEPQAAAWAGRSFEQMRAPLVAAGGTARPAEWNGHFLWSTYLVVGSCVHVVLHDRRSAVVFALTLDLHKCKCGDDVSDSHNGTAVAQRHAALTLREVRSREASVTLGVSGGAALVLNLQQHAQIR